MISGLAKSSGAALLAVLIVSTVIVVMMGVASSLMDDRLDLAQDSLKLFHNKATVNTKLSEISYLLATQPITVAGVSQGLTSLPAADTQFRSAFSIIGDEIRTDGYVYKTNDGLQFGLQNESGLIPVNTSTQYWFKKWLEAKGFSNIQQNRYADILADYADPDDWRRAAGAENHSYEANDELIPMNFLLQSCTELARVKLFRQLLDSNRELVDHCSLRRSGKLNLNQVPVGLWNTLWPSSAEYVQQSRLNNKWLSNKSSMFNKEPALLVTSDEYLSTLGGDNFQVRVEAGAVKKQIRLKRGKGVLNPVTFYPH